MLTAELGRNFVEIGDDVIPGQVEMPGDVGGQYAVASTGQQLRGPADSPVAV